QRQIPGTIKSDAVYSHAAWSHHGTRTRGREVRRLTAVPAVVMAALLAAATVAVAAGSDTRVSIGSPTTPMSADKQNEPAVAVDAHAPNVVVAGANDNIDVEACN